MPSVRVRICNVRGLHARAAKRFAETAKSFETGVEVSRYCAPDQQLPDSAAAEGPVDGQSIMDLLLLNAAPGCDLVIAADGPDADAALEKLARLVENGFDEDRDGLR